METVAHRLENTKQEYQTLFSHLKKFGPCATDFDWDEIRNILQTKAGWTAEGSKHIETLARGYGSFVLRNALALAITLNIEDGNLGL